MNREQRNADRIWNFAGDDGLAESARRVRMAIERDHAELPTGSRLRLKEQIMAQAMAQERDFGRKWSGTWISAAAAIALCLAMVAAGAGWFAPAPLGQTSTNQLAWAPATVAATPALDVASCDTRHGVPVVPLDIANQQSGTFITWELQSLSDGTGILTLHCEGHAPQVISENVRYYDDGRHPGQIIMLVSTPQPRYPEFTVSRTFDMTTGMTTTLFEAEELDPSQSPSAGLFTMRDGRLVAVSPESGRKFTVVENFPSEMLSTRYARLIINARSIDDQLIQTYGFLDESSEFMFDRRIVRADVSGMPGDLVSVNFSSGTVNWITLDTDQDISRIALSRDGSKIAAMLLDPVDRTNPDAQIAIFSVETGALITATSTRAFSEPYLTWTNDDQQLAFLSQDNLIALTATAGGRTRDVYRSNRSLDGLTSNGDGSRLWFSTTEQSNSGPVGSTLTIWNPTNDSMQTFTGTNQNWVLPLGDSSASYIVMRQTNADEVTATFIVIDPSTGFIVGSQTIDEDPEYADLNPVTGYFALGSPGTPPEIGMYHVSASQYLFVWADRGQFESRLLPLLPEVMNDTGVSYLTNSQQTVVAFQYSDGRAWSLDLTDPNASWQEVPTPAEGASAYRYVVITGTDEP